jgi:hypothetical protein
MTAPDQVLMSGVLQSGAVASVHLKGGTANRTGFLFDIHGTEGAPAIVPADPRQTTYIQAPSSLRAVRRRANRSRISLYRRGMAGFHRQSRRGCLSTLRSCTRG